VSLIRPYPQVFCDAVQAWVQAQLGDCGDVNRASDIKMEPKEYDDWDEG